MNNNTEEYAVYQLKLPQDLWKRFKIKSLTDNKSNYRETIQELVEKYVGR